MFHTSAALVVLLVGTVSGRRENIAVHSSLDWNFNQDQLKELDTIIGKVWSHFQNRAKVSGDKPVGMCIKDQFRYVGASSGGHDDCGNGVNFAGWTIMFTRLGLWSDPDVVAGMTDLFNILAVPGSYRDTKCVQPDAATNALTLQKFTENQVRFGVVKHVFESITGSISTPMEIGNKKMCKTPEKQQYFFACMHGNCGEDQKSTTPVTFNEFLIYYNNLGMFIKNDDFFVTMLVNAWHIMDGGYAGKNTVNKAVRCWKTGETPEADAGEYIRLEDDCFTMTEPNIIAAIKDQQGKEFETCHQSELM